MVTGETKMRKKANYKLTMEQKKEIWKLYNDGFTPSDIAGKFGISRVTVYRIGINNKYASGKS
ncbi:MAG: helix-turn-helix domain-containing protein [Patescibacteria group bacterium]